MSFVTTEERVESLEKVFAEFVATMAVLEKRADLRDQMAELRTSRFEQEMREFKDEMSEFKDEMSEFKDEMREFKDEMRVFRDESQRNLQSYKDESQRNWQASDLKSETSRKEFQRNFLSYKEENRLARREMAKQWSDIANKMGTIVEDILAPNLRRLAKEHFKVTSILDFSIRHKRSHPLDRSREEEFDTIVISDNLVIVGEAKSTVRAADPAEFADKLRRFREYFPEYADRRIVGVLGSWGIDPSLIKPLTKLGIYAMCMGDETMELVNAEEVEHSSKARGK